MDVGVYVAELLQRIDEVSLSGIGTFYKKRTSAYHDNKQGIFFPPSEEYAFDPARQDSGFALVEYVCAVRNISEPSARYFIEKYIDSIKQSIQIKGYATIDSLGKLRSSNNSYILEPAEFANSSISYGLIPVMEIERKAKKINNSNEPDFSAIRIKSPAPTVQDAPPQAVHKESKEPQEKSNKSAILIVITFLALGAALVAGYFLYPKFFRQKDQNTVIVPVTKTTNPPQRKLDSAQTASNKELVNSEAAADSLFENSMTQLNQEKGITVEKPRDTVVITTKTTPLRKTKDSTSTAVLPPSPSSAIKFEVIVAAFNKQSEAEDYISQLRKKGIDAKVVNDIRKPKFKISTGTFANEESAQKERRRLRETKIGQDAWVFTVKNK
ncbi:SPOR domain-containing protein [Desertivirga arenae]|uniref:SPOR domain-containing protein n=1 Tax=Desertivirga arenae TaxID=2810309 RepID=UPI001A95AB59|nr:SPOR domain-containing protein [Pedobacter sp. SYSU D00823]